MTNVSPSDVIRPSAPAGNADSVAEPFPKVFIDQSHDFLFIVLHLGFFLKYNGFLGTLSSATLDTSLYERCDVVVTHQGWSTVSYEDNQIAALRRFVDAGGGLLLIGYGPGASRILAKAGQPFDGWSMNLLAAAFGFAFSHESGELPLSVKPHPLTEGVGTLDLGREPNAVGILSPPPSAVPLVVDSSGRPVVAVARYGRGRVAAIAGYHFIPKIEEPANNALFTNLFHWLGENSPHRNEFSAKEPESVFPGIELHKGWDYEMAGRTDLSPRWDEEGSEFIWPELEIRRDSIVFQYTRALEPHIGFLIKAYPDVYSTICGMFQSAPGGRLYVQALPTAGGGYHWGKQGVVAIGCLSEPNSVIAIMAHELVHAWGLPTPRNFAHGWTTFTDDYIAERLHLSPSAEIESRWQQELKKVKEVDPGLDRLDITATARDAAEQRLLDKKVGMILKELHERFGIETFARFVQLCRQSGAVRRDADPDRPTLSLDSFVHLFSQAAQEDLVPLFRRYGATVRPKGD